MRMDLTKVVRIAPPTLAQSASFRDPAIAAFLASIPDDAELAALTAERGRLELAGVTIAYRSRDIPGEIAAIDAALVDAEGDARRTLLLDRAALMAEEASLPTQSQSAWQREARGTLATLQRIRRLAGDAKGSELATAAIDAVAVVVGKTFPPGTEVDLDHAETWEGTVTALGEQIITATKSAA